MGIGHPWGGSPGNGFLPGAHNLQDLGILTPEQFGAIGDGVTNDIAPLEAFRDAAATQRAIGYLRNRYSVSRPLVIGGGNTWFGLASALDIAPRGAIVAAAPMSAPVVVQQNSQQVSNRLTGISFEGARLAKCALIRRGDLNATFRQCLFLTGVVDGVRSANSSTDPVVSAVTQVGPGPALVASVGDLTYLEISGSNVKLKIDTPGARDVATFFLSTDGGITYSPLSQPLSAITQIAYPAGVNWGTSTGVFLTALADGFQAGTTYAFSVADVSAINNAAVYDKCLASDCGMIYATAGRIGLYAAPTYVTTLATGTISTVAGSNILQGTGTHFLSFGARDGDQWGIQGLSMPNPAGGGPLFQWLQNAVVISDSVAIASTPANQTLANVQFVCCVGAGFWEDVESGSQNDTLMLQPTSNNCAVGYRVGGLGGWQLCNPIAKNFGSVAVSAGTVFAD